MPANKPKILSVDDEPVNLFILEEILEADYEVMTVESGQACLDEVDGIQPDLILLDISMPGMSGLEVCEQLKTNPKTQAIPVIFLTALSSEEVELQGFEAGAVDFITKPFSEPKLLARVKTHIDLMQMRKALETSNSQLRREKIYIEEIVSKIREDKVCDRSHLTSFIKSYDRTNGDLLLSKKTGGDKQYILLGDFTGHGLGAAICAPLIMCLFYRDVDECDDIYTLLQRINLELLERLPTQIFMTAAAVELNWKTGEVALFNCGLPECLLFDQGRFVKSFKSTSLPLGVENQLKGEVSNFTLSPEHSLVLHTDGVVEARSAQNDLFGIDRLIQSLERICQNGLALSEVEKEVMAFAGDGQLEDDISLVRISLDS